MRKCLYGVLGIGLMGGVQACAPKACDEDAGYRAARLQLDRGDETFKALKLRVTSHDELVRILLDRGSDKAFDVRILHAVDNEYLKGIALLGKTYRLNEEYSIDDTGLGLLAADDMDRQGQPIWATEERQGVLETRLSMYRDGHNCSGN